MLDEVHSYAISSHYCVTYVGVIWFSFCVLQFLLIIITQENSSCISKSMMKHLQNLERFVKLSLPWFSYGYHKCMFVTFITKYIGPPNCVHY